MGVGVTLALLYVGGGSLIMPMWLAVELIFIELMITTAVAILFSSFSSPSLSALLAFLVFVIGHMSSSLRDLAAALGSKAATVVFNAIYYILPNLSLYTFRTEAANGMNVTVPMFALALGYAVAYIVVLLAITIAIFPLTQLQIDELEAGEKSVSAIVGRRRTLGVDNDLRQRGRSSSPTSRKRR